LRKVSRVGQAGSGFRWQRFRRQLAGRRLSWPWTGCTTRDDCCRHGMKLWRIASLEMGCRSTGSLTPQLMKSVAKPRTKRNLKLYPEPSTRVAEPQTESLSSLPGVLRAFQQTTGWSLQFVGGAEPRQTGSLTWSAPVNPGAGATPGHLRLDPLDPAKAATTGNRSTGNRLTWARPEPWHRQWAAC